MAKRHDGPFDVSKLLDEIDNLKSSQVTISLNDIIDIIKNENSKIITFTGAGISTAAGIPDFRSENGLYNMVKSKMNVSNPEMVFDLDYFKTDPTLFYCVAKEFIEKDYIPTLTHCFIKLLHQKKLLLRNFTQNIDGLDSKVGIPDEINVECHGHFKTGHCLTCLKEYSLEEMKKELENQDFIKCVVSSCGGIVKPDIILFGESLPVKVFDNIRKIPEADLIIIMGSSLRVSPFNQFIMLTKEGTPSLTINNEKPMPLFLSDKNFFLQSSCDDAVRKMCQLLQWESELTKIFSQFH